eukprot:TRINITY_DN2263_c0_g2_i1.p1 TRINITY_DN2263_c0_g2~~TRINITY_DN2263_c0_g2_i1.p1  ORF type:complete len:246 (-),score=47.88 TRINITY_DN2263_c0_g2_i1:123-803(-)
MLPTLTDDYEHELSVLSRLKSPYIVNLIGAFTSHNHNYIVMEYLPNNLHNYLTTSNEETSPSFTRFKIATDILNGLHYLHQHNIIHSDLKDANILLTSNLNAKICDFGVSKLKSLTSTGTIAGPSVAGTLRWMAPELSLVEGTKTSKCSDVFSFGVILWQLYSFKIPYSECVMDIQIIYKWAKMQNQIVLSVPDKMPKNVSDVMVNCLNWDPKQRPTSKQLLQLLA